MAAENEKDGFSTTENAARSLTGIFLVFCVMTQSRATQVKLESI